jgi:DNA repair/transcription protein MET18/MMS19
LKILEAATGGYGARTVALYAITLWDSVKFDILQVQDEERARISLDVLIAIGKTLSSGPAQGLAGYLNPVIKECNEHLEDAPTKQSDAACRILTALASSSAHACNTIISSVFPHLFNLVQSSDSTSKRRSLVQVLRDLLQADCNVFGDWQQVPNLSASNHTDNHSLPENGLTQFTKPILDFLQGSLGSTPVTEVSLRLVLTDASLQLAKIREVLSDQQISHIVGLFNNIVINEESYTKDSVKIAAVGALQEIAHQKPQIIIDTTFPALMARLPDTDIGSTEKYVPILEAFAKISVEDRLFATSLIRLKHRVLAAVSQKASPVYLDSILSTILYIFQNANPQLLEAATSANAYRDMVLPLLTQVCPTLCLDQRQDLTYALIGRIANVVIRLQPADFQAELVPNIFNISSPTPSPVLLFSPHSVEETRHLLVSLHLLAALRREVHLPLETHELLGALVAVVKAAEPSTSVKAASLLQISLIVNKFIPNTELKSVLLPFIDSNLRNTSVETLSFDAIRVGFAILKGLMLRNAPLAKDLYTILIDALSNPATGRQAAQGFSTLLQEEEVLTKANHCNISALHKQKTFAMSVPAIADGFRKAALDSKTNYLVALSGILQWLPYSAFESEASSIAPLLLQTLDIQGEHDMKLGAIDKITTIMRESPDIIEGHAGSVIARLLNLLSSTAQDPAPPAVRAKALRCLSQLPSTLRLEIALPFQKQVVKKLIDSLDDDRRGVRGEAVSCRSKWINLDNNDENEDEDD